MTDSAKTERNSRIVWRIALMGWSVLFVAYTLMFWWFGFSDLGEAIQRALFNTIPAALLAWPTAKLIELYIVDARLAVQMPSHLGLALAYGLLWYIGVQVGYGLQNGLPATGIVGRAFSGPALAWQLFQGVTLYAVVALFAYAVTYRTRLDALQEAHARAVSPSAAATPAAPQQILLKDGRTIRPVALDDVRLLSGAGDYTEVSTRDGTFLSSTSLTAFEADLPASQFLRVHRSHIVRTDAVLSVESGGNGRLTLHLPNGQSVTTSRAGAKAVRERSL